MAKLYLISFDKDLGNRPFFFTGNSNGNHPKYEYGKAGYTTILGKAKYYKTLTNATKVAKKLCVELGFKKQIKIHEWQPSFFDTTNIIKVI